jgi:IS30 family transposase
VLAHGLAGRVDHGCSLTLNYGPWCRTSCRMEWSPEQIACYLRITLRDRPVWHICHETIYQALYPPDHPCAAAYKIV